MLILTNQSCILKPHEMQLGAKKSAALQIPANPQTGVTVDGQTLQTAGGRGQSGHHFREQSANIPKS